MLRRLFQRGAVVASAALSSSALSLSAPAPAASPSELRWIDCEDGTRVQPWSAPARASQLRRLRDETFDVVVIGGGCVGAGVAWEASTRGLRVALVERGDFSSGTSSRSTKLLHGGVRYLEAAVMGLDREAFAMVTEALAERAHCMHAAPYMASALPIIIPVYEAWRLPYVWLGAKAYDAVAALAGGVAGGGLPGSHFMSASAALHAFPMLAPEGLKGAVVYFDGIHNDSRMNMAIALTAAQAGASIANYVGVLAVTHDEASGAANGVAVRDALTGEEWVVRARAVVNATGAFGDAVRALDDAAAPPLIVGASGTHLILPDHFSPERMGLIVPRTRDGRVLFFLPWEGMTIVGTTDAPAAVEALPRPSDAEARFLLDEANRYLARKLTSADVRAAWTGIRPLIKDPAKLAAGTAALSRHHVVEVSKKTGLVSVLGGKWTTYRRMAEDAVDALARAQRLELPPSRTAAMQLIGADRAGIVVNRHYDRIPVTLRETFGLDKEVARHLARNYGTRALSVAQLAAASPGGAGAARLCRRHPVIAAEVLFAVQQEYALTAVDVLARRTRLAFLDAAAAREALPAVIDIMAPALGWSAARRREEAAAAADFLDGMITPESRAFAVEPGQAAASG